MALVRLGPAASDGVRFQHFQGFRPFQCHQIAGVNGPFLFVSLFKELEVLEVLEVVGYH